MKNTSDGPPQHDNDDTAGDWRLAAAPKPGRRPDWYDYFGYLAAAAIMIPVGWWAKDHIQPELVAWINGLLGRG